MVRQALLVSMAFLPLVLQGQQSGDAALQRTLNELDSALFGAYNSCDLKAFRGLLDENIEFYHDQGGVTLGAQELTDSVRKNICGHVRRELVASSVEVYPIKGFGAVQTGIHRFYERQGEEHKLTGEAKFIHLWKKTGDGWRLTRVFSVDHHPAK